MKKLAIVTADFNNHKDTDEWLASGKILDTEGLEILWLVIDNGHNTVNLFLRHQTKVGAFGKVSPDHLVCVFH